MSYKERALFLNTKYRQSDHAKNESFDRIHRAGLFSTVAPSSTIGIIVALEIIVRR